jgi:hypothetical protein
MLLIIVVCLGMFGTYRITYDYTREFVQDDGSIKQLHGPFKIYAWIREWVPKQSWLPDWVRETSDCFYCVSFWIGCMMAGLTFVAIPEIISYNPVVLLARLMIFGCAYSAPTIWWASRNRLMYDQKPGSY